MEPNDTIPETEAEAAARIAAEAAVPTPPEATEPAVVNHVVEHRTFAREDADTPMPVTTTGA